MIELADAAQACEAELLACAGKRLPEPSCMLVDPCQKCTRRFVVPRSLNHVIGAAARFVEAGPKVGWQCPNRRAA